MERNQEIFKMMYDYYGGIPRKIMEFYLMYSDLEDKTIEVLKEKVEEEIRNECAQNYKGNTIANSEKSIVLQYMGEGMHFGARPKIAPGTQDIKKFLIEWNPNTEPLSFLLREKLETISIKETAPYYYEAAVHKFFTTNKELRQIQHRTLKIIQFNVSLSKVKKVVKNKEKITTKKTTIKNKKIINVQIKWTISEMNVLEKDKEKTNNNQQELFGSVQFNYSTFWKFEEVRTTNSYYRPITTTFPCIDSYIGPNKFLQMTMSGEKTLSTDHIVDYMLTLNDKERKRTNFQLFYFTPFGGDFDVKIDDKREMTKNNYSRHYVMNFLENYKDEIKTNEDFFVEKVFTVIIKHASIDPCVTRYRDCNKL